MCLERRRRHRVNFVLGRRSRRAPGACASLGFLLRVRSRWLHAVWAGSSAGAPAPAGSPSAGVHRSGTPPPCRFHTVSSCPAFIGFQGHGNAFRFVFVESCRRRGEAGDRRVSVERRDARMSWIGNAPRKGFGVSGFARIRDAPMMPAPMKPSLVGVGESAAMVTTTAWSGRGGEVGVDRLLGGGGVSGVPVVVSVGLDKRRWTRRGTGPMAPVDARRGAQRLTTMPRAWCGAAVCRRPSRSARTSRRRHSERRSRGEGGLACPTCRGEEEKVGSDTDHAAGGPPATGKPFGKTFSFRRVRSHSSWHPQVTHGRGERG